MVSSTFEVIYLGTVADLDPVESSGFSENAGSIAGSTFGGTGSPLYDNIGILSAVGSPGALYETNNSVANEQFSIDGGPAQTFDNVIQYNATITYLDTTTATITAVIFQDTNGNIYLAPEITNNADQAALESQPIVSITLDSVNNAANLGMDVIRYEGDFVCFTHGTKITTIHGEIPVEDLALGDMILTMDHGFQPIRWIGHRKIAGHGRAAPVQFAAGALSNNAQLRVSQQHRMLLSNFDFASAFGSDEILVPAKKLVNESTIRIVPCDEVEYFHILFDRHEIIYAEGCPSESLYLGAETLKTLSPDALAEIELIFPEIVRAGGIESRVGSGARPFVSRKKELRQIGMQI